MKLKKAYREIPDIPGLNKIQQIEKLETGFTEFDALTGGLVKGGITEVFGEQGSGKRSVVCFLLAMLTSKNKRCAIVDTDNSFDPESAAKTGVNLDKILWLPCDNDPQKSIICTDYIIQANLFDAIWLDLSLCDEKFLGNVPNAYWFRFKVGLKDTSSTLIITLPDSRLRSAAHQSIRVARENLSWLGKSNFSIPSVWKVKMGQLRPSKNDIEVKIFSDHLNA